MKLPFIAFFLSLASLHMQGQAQLLITEVSADQGISDFMGGSCDWLEIINSSEENGIDVLRSKIKQFASTVSLNGGKYKVVILDEADYLNAQSTQPALRGFIEEFSSNCRFIFTCNFKNRIIEPTRRDCKKST